MVQVGIPGGFVQFLTVTSPLQMAPDYDHLTLMQKVEVFEHAVNNTAGDDLAKLLWLKSPSSEVNSAHIMACVWQAAKCGIAFSAEGEGDGVYSS